MPAYIASRSKLACALAEQGESYSTACGTRRSKCIQLANVVGVIFTHDPKPQ